MDKTYLVNINSAYSFDSGAWGYFWLILVLGYIIKSLLLGRVFKKAGEKTWKAWVPFVNIWTYFQIAGYKGCKIFSLIIALIIFWVALYIENGVAQTILCAISGLLLICFYIYTIMAGVSIQKKLGKPTVFIVLMFINLIAPLWLWILALDYSKWNNKKGRVVKKSRKK
jgi:hypothetical protein